MREALALTDPQKRTHVVVVAIPRLEPLHVLNLCVVEPNRVAIVVVGVARAVVGVLAALVHVRVGVAVHEGHGKGVVQGGGAGVRLEAAVAQPKSNVAITNFRQL
jgi:hypothetical protein